VCHRPSVSLNKEKVSREIRENKMAVCEKTQGLRRGNFSDLNSACSKVLVPVKIFQFHHMHYESERYRAQQTAYYIAGVKSRAGFATGLDTRQDMASVTSIVTSCHQRAFLFTNTRLFYVIATG
jgi:hypothetical protein